MVGFRSILFLFSKIIKSSYFLRGFLAISLFYLSMNMMRRKMIMVLLLTCKLSIELCICFIYQM